MPPHDRPARLGRGLAALFGELPDQAESHPRTLALSDLEPGPFQPRLAMDEKGLEELADSIREQGVLQPVLVRPHPTAAGVFQIIAGERRWRAAGIAGLTEVPVFVRVLPDADAMAAGLIENLQRRDLDAIEEASGMRRLIDEFGLTQDRLGRALGKSRSHITNSLRLLTLPTSVQNHVSAGRLSAGHARAALAHQDPEAAAAEMLQRRMTVREAERLAASDARVPRSGSGHPNADVLDLSARLSERLGLLVSIRHSSAGGRISISYRTLEQLDRLLTLLG